MCSMPIVFTRILMLITNAMTKIDISSTPRGACTHMELAPYTKELHESNNHGNSCIIQTSSIRPVGERLAIN